MYSELFEDPAANLAWFVFLDERAHRSYPDWGRAANDTVAILRTEAGRDPYDKALTDLVANCRSAGELAFPVWR